MKNKITYLILVVVGLGLASCSEDFLDREPLTQRVETNFYQTEQDAFEALVAVYDVLQWQTGGGYHPYDLIGNILSDDAYSGGSGPGDRPGLGRMAKYETYESDEEPLGLWKDRYSGIYRANLLLDRIEGIEFDDSTLKTQYIAEARFLRGYYYYELVQLFGNVPLILKPLEAGEYDQPQAAPADVYNQIASDLWFAYNNLENSYGTEYTGRVTNWAAGAMLARVYMYHDGYGKGVLNITSDLTADDKVLTETDIETILEAIITESGHGLADTYADLFGTSNENNIESIFEIQHTDKADWGDWGWANGTEGNWAVIMSGFRGIDDPVYESGWSFQPATQNLINQFDAGDTRYSVAILDAEVEGLKYKPQDCYQHTGYAFKKVHPVKADKPATNSDLNWPNNRMVIRFADVLLMAAELNLDNDLGKAQGYYEQVQKRAFGDAYVSPSLSNDETGLDLIYKERRVEFAGEGLRYWDLLRRGLDYTSAQINSISGSAPYDVTFNAATKGLLPIPQSEINVSNNSLVQNDGYL